MSFTCADTLGVGSQGDPTPFDCTGEDNGAAPTPESILCDSPGCSSELCCTAAACTGTADDVVATCTGTANNSALTCDLDAGTDGSDACPAGCASSAAHTPTCDLDAGTDGSAACPTGCASSAAYTPTCDLDAGTDGSATCPSGCDDYARKQICTDVDGAGSDYDCESHVNDLDIYGTCTDSCTPGDCCTVAPEDSGSDFYNYGGYGGGSYIGSTYDGSVNFDFKHIIGILFLIFIFISIMGLLN